MRIKLIVSILIISLFFNITSCTSNNNQDNLDTSLSNNDGSFLKYWSLSLLSMHGIIIVAEVVKKGSGIGIAIVGTSLTILSIPIYLVYSIVSNTAWD